MGHIGTEERDYLLTEIRDIRAAGECAGDEVILRHIVNMCTVAMRVV